MPNMVVPIKTRPRRNVRLGSPAQSAEQIANSDKASTQRPATTPRLKCSQRSTIRRNVMA